MRYFGLLAVVMLMNVGCGDSDTGSAGATATAGTEAPAEASLAEALVQVNNGTAVLLDVRTDDEWTTAHFEKAKHVPLAKVQESADGTGLGLDKDVTIYVHCAAGKRAVTAADHLKDAGFKVQALATSYDAIKEAGFTEAAK